MQARVKERTDKRTRILDAAVKVFAGRGFHSATVAEIARSAGVADGTIYLYFRGKDDLLLQLFEEKMAGITRQAEAALALETSAAARLRRFITLHLSLVERNPELASVLIIELRQHAQLGRSGRGRERLANYLDLIAQVVKDGQESEELAPGISPATVKRAIFGALDELALAWLLSGRRTTLKKTAAETAEWLVRGLVAPQANGGRS